MKTSRIAIVILLALFVLVVGAQVDNGEAAETGAETSGPVRAIAEAGTETLSDLGERVGTAADTASEIGERVGAAAETASGIGERVGAAVAVEAPVKAGLAKAGDRVSEEINSVINQFVAQTVGWVGGELSKAIIGIAGEVGDLVQVVALALTVAFISFLAGMIIAVSGREQPGCAIVIAIGLIIGLLIGTRTNLGSGLVVGLVLGVFIPFMGTCAAVILVAAVKRWITGGKSLFAGAYHRLRKTPRSAK